MSAGKAFSLVAAPPSEQQDSDLSDDGTWETCSDTAELAVGDVVKVDKAVTSGNSRVLLQRGLRGRILKVEPETDDTDRSLLVDFPSAQRFNQNEH